MNISLSTFSYNVLVNNTSIIFKFYHYFIIIINIIWNILFMTEYIHIYVGDKEFAGLQIRFVTILMPTGLNFRQNNVWLKHITN